MKTWILWKTAKWYELCETLGLMWIVYIFSWGVWICLLWFWRICQKMLVFTNLDELCQINTLWQD